MGLSLIEEIRERRLLPAVGVYIGASWVVVEILDRLTERYFFSPYITDIVFWGLYSLIPAVILISWTHGRPGKDQSSRAEKVGVPINIIATIGLLLTVFGGKDLSATAELVMVNNELGQQEEYYVPRDSYRRRIAVFFWNNASGDAELDWLQYAVTELLSQDLQQSPFMLVTSPWDNLNHGIYNNMRQAGFEDGLGLPLNLMREIAESANRAHFIDGSVGSKNGDLHVTARVWSTESLEMLGEIKERGPSLLPLIDRIAEEVRTVLDVPPGKGGLAGDLPLQETYGDSEVALQNYIDGLNTVLFENDWNRSNAFLDAAIEADPEFVMAWFRKGMNLWEQGDSAAARQALANAQRLDYRLPERDQVVLKSLNYRLAGEQVKLEKFLRLQFQVKRDAASARNLARFLMYTGNLEEAKQHFLEAMDRDRSDLRSYMQLALIEQAIGNIDAAIEYVRRYQEARPDDTEGHLLAGDLLLEAGDLAASEAQYEQAQLIEDPPLTSTLRLALLAMRHGEWPQARALIEEARSLALTPTQFSTVLTAEMALEVRLGRVQRAIDLAADQFGYNSRVLSPLQQIFNYNVSVIHYYLLLNRLGDAEELIRQTREELQPPVSQFLSFSEAQLLAKQRRFEAAEAAVRDGSDAIDRFKADYLAFQIPLSQAVIATERGDFSAAARYYQDAIVKASRSVVGNELDTQMSTIYGACALAHVKAGELDIAQKVIDHGFQRDGAEPELWMARALLQQANGSNEMALASINYALAIWSDADPELANYRQALELKAQLAAGKD